MLHDSRPRYPRTRGVKLSAYQERSGVSQQVMMEARKSVEKSWTATEAHLHALQLFRKAANGAGQYSNAEFQVIIGVIYRVYTVEDTAADK